MHQTRRPRGLVIALVLGTLTFLLRPPGAPADVAFTPEQAKAHLGELATIRGTVASAKYASSSRGQPTFLNLDRPYPQQIFTVVIWDTDRPQFGTPETEYLGKRICVTGQIESYRGTPEIVVKEKSQLTVSGKAGATQGQASPQTSRSSAGSKLGVSEAGELPHFVPGLTNTVRVPLVPDKRPVFLAAGGGQSKC